MSTEDQQTTGLDGESDSDMEDSENGFAYSDNQSFEQRYSNWMTLHRERLEDFVTKHKREIRKFRKHDLAIKSEQGRHYIAEVLPKVVQTLFERSDYEDESEIMHVQELFSAFLKLAPKALMYHFRPTIQVVSVLTIATQDYADNFMHCSMASNYWYSPDEDELENLIDVDECGNKLVSGNLATFYKHHGLNNLITLLTRPLNKPKKKDEHAQKDKQEKEKKEEKEKKDEGEISQEEKDEDDQPVEFSPWDSLRDVESILHCLSHMIHCFNSDVKQRFGNHILEIVYSRILSFPGEKIKSEEIETIERCAQSALQILKFAFPEQYLQVYQKHEEYEISFALKCLACPYLKKRLWGLEDLKRFITSAQKKTENMEAELFERKMDADVVEVKHRYCTPSQYFDAQLAAKHLSMRTKGKEEIVELLFGDNYHIQILKRCQPVLNFLAKYDCLSEASLDKIWNASRGKHESTVTTVFEIIASLASCLMPRRAQYMFEKIKAIPFVEVTRDILKLAQQFSVHAISAYFAAKRVEIARKLVLKEDEMDLQLDGNKINEEDLEPPFINQDISQDCDTPRWYGVDLFWNIFVTEEPISDLIRHCAFCYVLDCLRWATCHPRRWDFVCLCVNNLESHIQVAASLRLFMDIMESLASDKNFEISSELAHLNREKNLINLLFVDLLSERGHVDASIMDRLQAAAASVLPPSPTPGAASESLNTSSSSTSALPISSPSSSSSTSMMVSTSPVFSQVAMQVVKDKKDEKTEKDEKIQEPVSATSSSSNGTSGSGGSCTRSSSISISTNNLSVNIPTPSHSGMTYEGFGIPLTTPNCDTLSTPVPDTILSFGSVEMKLQFLYYICLKCSPLGITATHVDLMWENFVLKRDVGEEGCVRDVVFAWLEKALALTYAPHKSVFSPETAEHIALKLTPTMDFEDISEQGYSFFHQYFRWVNWTKRKFEVQRYNHGYNLAKYTILEFDILMMDDLWEIAFRAKKKKVAGYAISLINRMHQNFAPRLVPRLKEKHEQAIKIVMDRLSARTKDSSSPQAELEIERSFLLLEMFLDKFAGSSRLGHGVPGSFLNISPSQSQSDGIMVKCSLTKQTGDSKTVLTKFEICLRDSDTVQRLHNTVAQRAKMPSEMIRIFFRGRRLQNMYETLKSVGVNHGEQFMCVAKDFSFADRTPDLPTVIIPAIVTPSTSSSAKLEEIKCDGEKEDKKEEIDLTDDEPHTRAPSPSRDRNSQPLGSHVPHPSEILSRPEHFDKLFNFLNLGGHLSDKCWSLLMKLPTNNKLLNIFRDLNEDTNEKMSDSDCDNDDHMPTSWRKLLSLEISVYEFRYSLQIIDKLFPDSYGITGDSRNRLYEMKYKFIACGGLNHLVDVLLSNDFILNDGSAEAGQKLECFALLLKIILRFEASDEKVHKPKIIELDGAGQDCGVNQDLVKQGESPEVLSGALLSRMLDLVRKAAEMADTLNTYSLRVDKAPLSSPVTGPVGPSVPMMSAGLGTSISPINLDDVPTIPTSSTASQYNSPLVTSVVSNCVKLISIMLKNPRISPCFFQYENLIDWIDQVLFRCKNTNIRKECGELLKTVCSYWLQTQSEVKFHLHVLKCLLELLQLGTSSKNDSLHLHHSRDFMELAQKLLDDVCRQIHHHPDSPIAKNHSQYIWDLFKRFGGQVINYPVTESVRMMNTDEQLVGLLKMCCTLTKNVDSVGKLVADMNLIDQVFERLLFSIATVDNRGDYCPPVCKTSDSRTAAFQLLLDLSKTSDVNSMKLFNLLLVHHKNPPERSGWFYDPIAMKKSKSGYAGLENLGATCYMNSLVQQLYMVPEFRYGVLSRPVPTLESAKEAEEKKTEEDGDKKDDDEDEEMTDDDLLLRHENNDLLYQLQIMFGYLQESSQKFFRPESFCKAYKDYDGRSMNTSTQMDVDEFFNMFFDKLEHSLKDDAQSKLMDYLFGGVLVNQLIGKECNHYSERTEQFYKISLEIKNKKSIQESLALYVEGDMLEGDNKYFCQTCDKRRDTLKRSCIKKPPRNLILHLKRFEFDLDAMRKVKLNDYCEFDEYLDVHDYLKQGLEEAEGKKYRVQDSKEPDEEDVGVTVYHLNGILVHSGTCDSGHYYSFIKERVPLPSGDEKTEKPSDDNCKWYQFNDCVVESFDPKDMKNLCFGGGETMHCWDNRSHQNVECKRDKPYNAYMLFYQRLTPKQATEYYEKERRKNKTSNSSDKTKPNGRRYAEHHIASPQPKKRKLNHQSPTKRGELVNTDPEELRSKFEICKPRDVPAPLTLSQSSALLPPTVFKDIWNLNTNLSKHQHIFDPKYFEFCWAVIRGIGDDKKNLNYEVLPESTLEITRAKLAVYFAVNTLSHCKAQKQSLSNYCDWMKEIFSNSVPSCIWFMEEYVRNKNIQAIWGTCININFRKLLCDLMIHIIVILKPHEDTFYNEFIEVEPPTETVSEHDRPSLEEGDENHQKRRKIDPDITPTSDEGDDSPPKKKRRKVDPETLDDCSDTEEEICTKTPKSYIIRAVSKMIDDIPSLHMKIKYVNNFFTFFHEFALLGAPEVKYLYENDVLKHLLQFYIANHKGQSKEKNRNPLKKWREKFHARLKPLVLCVSVLVLSVAMHEKLDHEYPGYGFQNPFTVQIPHSRDSWKYFFSDDNEILKVMITEDLCHEATMNIVCRMSWNDKEFTLKIQHILVALVNESTMELIPHIFEHLTAFLSLEDDLHKHRIDITLPALTQVIVQCLKFEHETNHSIDWFTKIIKKLQGVALWVFEFNNDWIFKMLTCTSFMYVRKKTAIFCKQLFDVHDRYIKLQLEIRDSNLAAMFSRRRKSVEIQQVKTPPESPPSTLSSSPSSMSTTVGLGSPKQSPTSPQSATDHNPHPSPIQATANSVPEPLVSAIKITGIAQPEHESEPILKTSSPASSQSSQPPLKPLPSQDFELTVDMMNNFVDFLFGEFKNLYQFIGKSKLPTKRRQSELVLGNWVLAEYFEVLTYFVRTKDQKRKACSEEFWQPLRDTVCGIIKEETDHDLELSTNKEQSLTFLIHLIDDCDENIPIIADDLELHSRILNCFIHLRTREDSKKYNEAVIPMSYQLILHCARRNHTFLTQFATESHTFSWAITKMVIETDDYPLSSEGVYELVKLVCECPDSATAVWRTKRIDALLSWYKPNIGAKSIFLDASLGSLKVLKLYIRDVNDYSTFINKDGFNVLTEKSKSSSRHPEYFEFYVGILHHILVFLSDHRKSTKSDRGVIDSCMMKWTPENKMNLIKQIITCFNDLNCQTDLLTRAIGVLMTAAELDQIFVSQAVRRFGRQLEVQFLNVVKKAYEIRHMKSEYNDRSHSGDILVPTKSLLKLESAKSISMSRNLTKSFYSAVQYLYTTSLHFAARNVAANCTDEDRKLQLLLGIFRWFMGDHLFPDEYNDEWTLKLELVISSRPHFKQIDSMPILCPVFLYLVIHQNYRLAQPSIQRFFAAVYARQVLPYVSKQGLEQDFESFICRICDHVVVYSKKIVTGSKMLKEKLEQIEDGRKGDESDIKLQNHVSDSVRYLLCELGSLKMLCNIDSDCFPEPLHKLMVNAQQRFEKLYESVADVAPVIEQIDPDSATIILTHLQEFAGAVQDLKVSLRKPKIVLVDDQNCKESGTEADGETRAADTETERNDAEQNDGANCDQQKTLEVCVDENVTMAVDEKGVGGSAAGVVNNGSVSISRGEVEVVDVSHGEEPEAVPDAVPVSDDALPQLEQFESVEGEVEPRHDEDVGSGSEEPPKDTDFDGENENMVDVEGQAQGHQQGQGHVSDSDPLGM